MTTGGEEPTHLWLRAETKPNEKRTALTPNTVKELLANGFNVTIEASTASAYDPQEYPEGAKVVKAGSWKTEAPKEAIVIGLKDLPESQEPLVHRHIMFGHAFKGQEGWTDFLKRFDDGQGTLLDIEFLQDAQGKVLVSFLVVVGVLFS